MASLFTTSSGKTPRRAIQFSDHTGARRTIRLGSCGLKTAQEYKRRIEWLVNSRIVNEAPDRQTSIWLSGLSDRMHAKLAAFDLISSRAPDVTMPTLQDWVAKYIRQRTPYWKPATIYNAERTGTLLCTYFGGDTSIERISADPAADWRSWLSERSMAEATVCLHCRNAKAMFKAAVDRELLPRNPFRQLKSGSVAAARGRYVTPDETVAIIDACPDVHWRVVIGLARYAGLRVPSEIKNLSWGDVDWIRRRLTVYSPKTERFQDHQQRMIPIVPQLLAILQDAYDRATPGQDFVIMRSMAKSYVHLRAIIRRAHVVNFSRPFRVFRQSCETEWTMTYPGHVVAAWLGHSESVSRKHYLMVTDDVFTRATGLAQCDDLVRAAKSAAAGRGTTSHGHATGHKGMNKKPEKLSVKRLLSAEKEVYDRHPPMSESVIPNNREVSQDAKSRINRAMNLRGRDQSCTGEGAAESAALESWMLSCPVPLSIDQLRYIRALW